MVELTHNNPIFQAFLKHPFFQSNMFCVYLSFVDVFQVVLVGIPAALSFTTKDPSYGDSFYNRCVLRSLVILNFERHVIKSTIKLQSQVLMQ